MQAALDGAMRVFRERGYHAASLSDLSAAMKLTTGSIYKAFNDKRAVFLAALDHYVDLRNAQLRQLLEAETSGFDKLRAALAFYAETSHDAEGRLGCLVVGSVTEVVTFDPEMAGRVTDAVRRIETMVRDLIRLGQSDGSIPAGVDADVSARTLLCVLEGLRVVGKAGRTRAEMMAVATQALLLLA